MAVKSFQEVMAALKPEPLELDYENIPEERGEFREPPKPGTYRFRLPAALGFEPLEIAAKNAEGKWVDAKGQVVEKIELAAKVQHVNVVFDEAHPLVFVGGPYDGEPFYTRISTLARNRFVTKDTKVKVSDLTYLLRAVAPEQRPTTIQAQAQVAAQVLPGKEFVARVEWSGYCNPKKDAYYLQAVDETKPNGEQAWLAYQDPNTGENMKGCGNRVWSNKWPKKADGTWEERATCSCNAGIRPFANLVGFKTA